MRLRSAVKRVLMIALVVAIAALARTEALEQPSKHRPASIADIRANPAAFHGELVELSGTVKRSGEQSLLSNTDGSLKLLSPTRIPDGDVEVRGMLLDLGRIRRDDARLDALKVKSIASQIYGERWPQPGEEVVVAVTRTERRSREVAAVVAPLPPLPLEVDFSAPIDGETDVRLDTSIRIQFSRGTDPSSFKDRIRLTYSQADSIERGEPQPPVIHFTTTYDAGTRALTIRPDRPLERFRQVKVELLEGIVGTDDSVLRPWTLTFWTGGS